VLHGRDVERARLAALVEDAGRARAGAVVVHGEAGAGKSALLEDVIAGAVGVRVLRTQGLESESPLAFAALHRLLRPVRQVLDRLPVPQARALRVAFGEEEGAAVDPFLVALATLSALTEAAEASPVLCLIDDAHWLDGASADALLFAARRLQADRVAMVFATRDADAREFRHDGIPALHLGALDGTAARALIADRVGAPLPDEVCDQLLMQAGGNPLALVELPTALTPAQLHGSEVLPSRLHLTAAVERVFLDRCRRLSEHVQTVLLVAAADDSGRLATVRHAAALLGADSRALQEAERSGLLLTEGDSVRVRHPLVRSAVYQAATGLERREAHRALAEALAGVDDADRQAWHRAAAAEGPDEDVAAALERVAVRAERRGGHGAAAAAYERAAELTAGDHDRAARLFAAARNAWTGGRTTRARRLSEAARALADERLLRADIDRLRARIAYYLGSASEGHRILMQAARAVAADAPSRALEMTAVATVLAVYGGDSGLGLDPAALSTDPAPDDTPYTRCLKQLLTGMAAAGRSDWAAAAAPLRDALALGIELGGRDLLPNLGAAALHLGDDASAEACFTAMIAEGRVNGAGMLVLYALPRLVFPQLLTGRWAAAGASAEEALTLSGSAGQPAMTGAPLALLTLLAARQGSPRYDALLTGLEEVVASQPLGILAGPVRDVTSWAKATRAAAAGDPGTAFHHLDRVRLPAIRRMAVVDLLDAAVRSDERDAASASVEELACFADGTGWPWALAVVDHGRALLAPVARAPELFEGSLAHHAAAGRPYERARTHLAYGEFLRRAQRRVDARVHLRLALAIFEDMQAEPLIARATQELRASGETARTRDPSTLLALTPMELKVAELVGQGLSTKDVAAECWISPRTVEFHLRNCFAKTGVTSRAQLARLQLTQPTTG
jgi:DNA-binding CsgD family transcriptional regulator/tetratricopeptide (TPR) repeat protein